MKNIFVCIKKSKIITLCVCVILIVSHIVLYLNIDNYKKVVDSLKNQIFNGFDYNFSQNQKDGDIYFVSSVFQGKNLGLNKPTLCLPTDEEFENNNGVLSFKIKQNFVIKSAGDGVVKSVGILDNGKKYIEIKHSGNIISRYENLKIVGVGANFLVKSTNIIGSCDENSNFVFKLTKNGQIIADYSIKEGKIEWQN